MVPCNPVLKRAGTDDTIEDALEYYHAVVGDRTPRELQDTYVRGGAGLIEYLEADDNLKFAPMPRPDYFGKAPMAAPTVNATSRPGRSRWQKAPHLRELVRGPARRRPARRRTARRLLHRRPGADRPVPQSH